MNRTAEMVTARYVFFQSSVFTDFVTNSCNPSDELLGYFQSSANADWAVTLFVQTRLAHGGLLYITSPATTLKVVCYRAPMWKALGPCGAQVARRAQALRA